MTDEYRADEFVIKDMADKVDKNGYLRIKGTFTKTGVFSYPQPDGTVIRELRHPDDVFKSDSMATISMVPLIPIAQHEAVINGTMRPNEVSKFTHLGVTGENIARTPDDCIDGSLSIYDKDTIEKTIRADKSGQPFQLSASYEVGSLDHTPGVYKGESYDRIQRNIVYGHVSLVPRGRAGSRCHTRADSAGKLIKPNQEKNMDKVKIPALEIGSGNNIFRADAIEYEDTPGANALVSRATQLGVELAKTQTRADKAEGELSVLKKSNDELQELQKGLIKPDTFRADLKESLELSLMAAEIGLKLGDDVTPNAIKLAICKADNPKLDARADTDMGFLSGVFAGVESDWKQRVSKIKTLQGLDHSKQKNEQVSETEYIDYGNIKG
jgi:hypothetical protein